MLNVKLVSEYDYFINLSGEDRKSIDLIETKLLFPCFKEFMRHIASDVALNELTENYMLRIKIQVHAEDLKPNENK